MTSTGPVALSFEGDVAEIVIDRPETRNAISSAVMDGLEQAITAVEELAVGAVVVRGAGDRVFVSGGDLKELAEVRDLESAQAMAVRMRGILDRLGRLPVPVVAVVNGDAYGGGGEVALACDMRIAADDIRMGFTHVHLGIMPAWGGVERLVSLVGRGRAMYLLATGTVVNGADLLTWGLAEEVVPRASFEERWHALAHGLAKVPRDALVGIKAVANAIVPREHPQTADLATTAFARTWVSDGHWDAVASQRERRRIGAAGRSTT
ncbi:MAG: enoyl-CoA hydratase/isomerase family protein [Acidimicrobiales bacterium]